MDGRPDFPGKESPGVAFAKIAKQLYEKEPFWPPSVTMQEMTMPELEVILSPSGRIAKEQAQEVMNERRRRRGLPPIDMVM